MNAPIRKKQQKFLLKTLIVCILLYILFLLSSIFLGTGLKKNASRAVKDMTSFLACSIFQNDSATISYCLDPNRKDVTKQLLTNALYSPVIQYVQPSSEHSSHYQLSNSIKILTKEAAPASTPSSATTPLMASSQSDFETNASLDSYDNVYFEDEYDVSTAMASAELSGSEKQQLQANQRAIKNLTACMDRDYLLKTFYKINPSCVIDPAVWNVKKMLAKDVTITKKSGGPQILIFHTHAHETFADSRPGVRSDSIVGVGDELTSILTKKYGFEVMHYTKQYNYNTSYNEALKDLTRILKEHPSIQVVLDIHRDGVSEQSAIHSVVNVGDKKMAPIMFFNGVSNNKKSSLNFHTNKNLQANLAFSLQMKLYAMQTYPQFTKKNFLKSFRYNMHVVERYSLIEVGDNNNTVAEVKAAMEPLADILNHVLTTKD